jgi:hypothetical protein
MFSLATSVMLFPLQDSIAIAICLRARAFRTNSFTLE